MLHEKVSTGPNLNVVVAYLRPLCENMKVNFLLFLAIILFTKISAYAECSCINLAHDRTKQHIRLSLSSAPHLKFFDNRRMKGKPHILLNEKGAYIDNDLICSWPHESFSQALEPNRVLGFDGQEVNKPCPAGFPIESGFGDLGVGTAVLCLEIIQQTDGIIEISYKNKSYYLDAKSLKGMNWKNESGTNEPCAQPQ